LFLVTIQQLQHKKTEKFSNERFGGGFFVIT